MGEMQYNLFYLTMEDGDFMKNVDLTMHECTHILVFSSTHFSYYLNDNGTLRGIANVRQWNINILLIKFYIYFYTSNLTKINLSKRY